MNKEHLMNNGKLFAYETSKYFSSPERLLKQYTCKDEIVVLSNKRLFIYTCIKFIDVTEDTLKNLTITQHDNECDVVLKGKEFHLVFESKDELDTLMNYYEENKDL